MKCLIVNLIALGLCALNVQSLPAVEIKQQRLVGLPQERSDSPTVASNDGPQSAETQRILDEIDKINRAFGYTRRAFPISSKVATPNNGYFYPRAAYTPEFLRKGYGAPSRAYLGKKVTHKTVEYIPYPFQNPVYYYPTPYLQTPLVDKPRAFRILQDTTPANVPVQDNYIYRTLPKSIVTLKSPNVLQIDETGGIAEENRSMKSSENGNSAGTSLMEDIIRIVASDDLEEIRDLVEEQTLAPVHNDKYMMIDTIIDKKVKTARQENHAKPQEERVKGTTTLSPSVNDKIIKHFPTTTGRPASSKTVPLGKTKKPQDAPVETATKKDGLLKFPKFPFFQKDPVIESNAIDAIREGGIVIQRLKVRKGGIAIAGPGGVATAGSGGTAIVGPGGIALTHPRGLSIAGPGAKIYAIPETQDLEQVSRTIHARSFSGADSPVLVATGPIVYYHL